MTLENYAVPNLSQQLAPNIRYKIDQKTKPQGALGALESLALQIALIQNTLNPQLHQPMMLVFAGDHGITHEGVSPYPQAVTAQMVLNFLNGGAAINVFANLHGMHMQVIDSGVNYDFSEHSHLVNAKIGKGTRNFLREPAMRFEECELAMARGAELVAAHVKAGANVFGFGEMGIGNTSSASCLMSVLCGIPITECVGRGTGLDDAGLAKKVEILQKALAQHALDGNQPVQTLATFGGFEIAMMTGAMLAAAHHKTTLLIDGFIATSALLVAFKLQPNVLDYCVFAHCSGEAGHRKLLEYLKVKPLLDLGLRLGEGTGAALALPLLQAAVNFLNEMASFESAGVSQKC